MAGERVLQNNGNCLFCQSPSQSEDNSLRPFLQYLQIKQVETEMKPEDGVQGPPRFVEEDLEELEIKTGLCKGCGDLNQTFYNLSQTFYGRKHVKECLNIIKAKVKVGSEKNAGWMKYSLEEAIMRKALQKLDEDHAQMVEDDMEVSEGYAQVAEESVPEDPTSPTIIEMQGSSSTVNRQITIVTLSDDDENEPEGSSGESIGVNTLEHPDEQGSASPYGLRRKRKINYTEDVQLNQREAKKEDFDFFSHSNKRIGKIILKPELLNDHPECVVFFRDGRDTTLVEEFFKTCGSKFDSIIIDSRNMESFLKSILWNTSSLRKLDYIYHNQDDSLKLLELLKKLREQNRLTRLHSLALVGQSGVNRLTEKAMSFLSDLDISFRSLELGDALWEDVQVATLEKLLKRQKATLEDLVIHGGFFGDMKRQKKTRVLITIPKMEKLANLSICPDYTFVSEIQEPAELHSKKARTIDMGRVGPYKIAIKFLTDIPTLKRLVLGNLIEIEDFPFSKISILDTFRCGSYWNLPITFPPEGSRKALTEADVTELQFPDALKDPSFVVKVAKHFPKLRKVWMFLPSVPVVRAFFKAFENFRLEELYLKTQFDFESTMESCLLPDMVDVLTRSPATNDLLETLKKYKHFKNYVRQYNIELPVEAGDLMEGYSAGIAALTNLKVLHIEHIPRRLLIPDPEDEGLWDVDNIKFTDKAFGYLSYHMNDRCRKEILKMKLVDYQLDNFHRFKIVSAEDVGSDEDIFEPVHRGRGSRRRAHRQLEIMPSMLFPKVEAKHDRS